MLPRGFAVLAGVGLLALVGPFVTGCSSSSAGAADAGGTSVVAAFYPLAYAAEQVGGNSVAVTSLTPPGVEPHDLELSAAQVAQIADADLVLYVKGFQAAVDEAVEQQAPDHAIDVSADLTLIGDDPHVWLDPANMASIGDTIAARISALEPDAAAAVAARMTAFDAAMTDLDASFRDGLATCTSRDLVVSHEAFGYLAAAYDLTQIGISGISPESEPSPARMKEVAELVRAEGITTIYYETLVDPKVAQTIADETGARAAVLDPLEGLQEGADDDYASIMRANLATLVDGQSCT